MVASIVMTYPVVNRSFPIIRSKRNSVFIIVSHPQQMADDDQIATTLLRMDGGDMDIAAIERIIDMLLASGGAAKMQVPSKIITTVYLF